MEKELVLTASDGKQYKVTVTYDTSAGIPEDAELEVQELSGERYQEYYALTLEALEETSLDYARIFDISIVGSDGTHYQPNSAVSVQVELMGEEAPTDELSVVHFGQEPAVLETVKDGRTVTFETDGFSVYAIGGNHVRTYRFVTYNNSTDMQYVEYKIYTDSDTTTYTQAIHNGQTLVAPQLPSLEDGTYKGLTFAGWYIGSGVTESDGIFSYTSLSDEAFNFDEIPEITSTETVYLFAKFNSYAYVIFHDQYNGNTDTFPVAQTRRGGERQHRKNYHPDRRFQRCL